MKKPRVYAGRQKNKPDRKLCDEVLKRVSERNLVRQYDVVFSTSTEHARIRGMVWDEIISLSGCSIYGLAAVWGVDHTSILSNLKKLRSRPQVCSPSTGTFLEHNLWSGRTVGDSERVTGALATPRPANAVT
jgi:hypothetical protein